jgi:hypothetical protein
MLDLRGKKLISRKNRIVKMVGKTAIYAREIKVGEDSMTLAGSHSPLMARGTQNRFFVVHVPA